MENFAKDNISAHGEISSSSEKERTAILKEPIEYPVEWEPKNEMEQTGARLAAMLREAGGEAYFAGGYSRDLIMSREPDVYPGYVFDPHDVDIATNIVPDEVERIMREQGIKTTAAGKNFKVIVATLEVEGRPVNFEIATFRIEGDYGEDRKPRFVETTRDKREDVERRDFTMNALLFDPEKRIVLDYVHGVEDIKNHVLRFVGNTQDRVVEDPLRILRYVRFRAKYGMEFHQETKRVLRENSPLLKRLSGARIKEEMDKILVLPRATFAVGDLARIGALKEIFPEIHTLIAVEHTPEEVSPAIHKEGNVFKHQLQTLRAIERPEFIQRVREKLQVNNVQSESEVIAAFYQRYGITFAWANLFHDMGKATTQQYHEVDEGKPARYSFYGHEQASLKMFDAIASSNRVIFSNEERERIKFLIENHMKAHEIASGEEGGLSERSKAKLFRSEDIEALLFFAFADQLGNYSDRATTQDKVAQFKKAWNELQNFRIEDQKRQEILKLEKKVSLVAMNIFTEENPIGKKGMPILGPIKTATLLLLIEGKIGEPQIESAIKDMKVMLQEKAILEVKNIREMNNQARSFLEQHYGIDFEDL